MTRWAEYQETGKVVNNEVMIDWLESWGIDQEKLCPVK
jgi:predicted transcriptional regulator